MDSQQQDDAVARVERVARSDRRRHVEHLEQRARRPEDLQPGDRGHLRRDHQGQDEAEHQRRPRADVGERREQRHHATDDSGEQRAAQRDLQRAPRRGPGRGLGQHGERGSAARGGERRFEDQPDDRRDREQQRDRDQDREQRRLGVAPGGALRSGSRVAHAVSGPRRRAAY
jgi:hypothetical protein